MIVNPSHTLTLKRELLAACTLIAFVIRTVSSIEGDVYHTECPEMAKKFH
jgi:hypothetical protein